MILTEEKMLLTEEKMILKDQMASRELEYTKQLALHVKPAVHNHYHQYAVHMTPWCIDPTHPSYNACLASDVDEMQEAMAELPPQPNYGNSISPDYEIRLDTMKRQDIFTTVLQKRLMDDRPRYIIPDMSRHKGMFLMPDGSVRLDPGLSMMMQHQFMIGLRIANMVCEWWFRTTHDRKQFRHMIIRTAGNGAVRIKHK